MPNLQQIIALRRSMLHYRRLVIPLIYKQRNLGDLFRISKNWRKHFSVEHIQPLFEHVPKPSFCYNCKKQTSNIVDYFEKQEKVHVVLFIY